ncbi:hypothetical protein [Cellulomonas soli]|uniref:Uncharacterized protein n=1 Tax=Cellulomonas soli TaxID=931535 RepID=A0A512PHN8_9CELL|nr:hypothetical protein [Cellulomonas soli]NYI59205.1 putative Zn-binding protein involved in type VI secretion [Cellulomonas soli]GEP70710.1 hypothetical protein CSO01_34250 [Cellulomonas soli]
MPGPPVAVGCVVVVTPGAAGAPDTGTLLVVLPPWVTANGMPLATTGSICTMVNSVTGVPYPLVIGPLGSSGVSVGGRGLVRMGDMIPSPPGVLQIVGPPATTSVSDGWPP